MFGKIGFSRSFVNDITHSEKILIHPSYYDHERFAKMKYIKMVTSSYSNGIIIYLRESFSYSIESFNVTYTIWDSLFVKIKHINSKKLKGNFY